MDHMDRTGIGSAAPLSGVAAGVPYVVLPPAGGFRRAPLVVAWHGLDPPRRQQAMAAALPLARLPAWRVYLGLPVLGTRAPAGGPKEVARLGVEDVVGELFGPVVEQAAAEFPTAVAALRAQLPVDDGPIGLLGGEVGAAVALLALAEGEIPVEAAALVRPAVQLERLDVVARAAQIAAQHPQPAVLLVTGAGDDAGVREPAERLWHTLAGRYRDPGRVVLVIVPGLAHALAAEPGLDPALQAPDAARVDAAVTGWFDRHLTSKEAS
jgi:dienelactone hydrolase